MSTERALADLQKTMRSQGLEVHYQPQVTADGKSIVSVEALVRWNHPGVGWITPAAFITFAEANGLIEELGTFVLRRACEQVMAWPDVSVAVNVSPLQFASPDFLSIVDAALSDAGLPPHRLEIEITEGALFGDPDRAEDLMRALRERGIRLALDDFGTGYSSLSYLRRMPWDKVKIDKSFVDDVTHITSAAIVHSIVALARAIGLKVTAEGVETEDQQRFLRLAGCHLLQGYLFSRPVPAPVIDAMLSPDRGALAEPVARSA